MPQSLSRTALYRQIADILRSEISQLKVGERLDSDDALTKRFSVSLGTIRDAMMLLDSGGYVERHHGKGTFVADRSRQDSNAGAYKHIAILIDKDISHPQLSYAHKRISQTLLHFFNDQGMDAKRYTGHKLPWEHDGELTCPDFLKAVKQDRLQAVVLIETKTHDSWLRPLMERGVPVIGGLGSPTHTLPDYKQMVCEAVDYLYEQNLRNIALLGWLGPDTVDASGNHIVHEAFEKHMNEIGLTVNHNWIRHDVHPSKLGAGWEQFREIWSASTRQRPDGLIVTDDVLFRDAATAILELSISVPDDLRIVTHSNKGSGVFSPLQVAQMETDPDDTAKELGRIAIEKLNNTYKAQSSFSIGFKWVVNESYLINTAHEAGVFT